MPHALHYSIRPSCRLPLFDYLRVDLNPVVVHYALNPSPEYSASLSDVSGQGLCLLRAEQPTAPHFPRPLSARGRLGQRKQTDLGPFRETKQDAEQDPSLLNHVLVDWNQTRGSSNNRVGGKYVTIPVCF